MKLPVRAAVVLGAVAVIAVAGYAGAAAYASGHASSGSRSAPGPARPAAAAPAQADLVLVPLATACRVVDTTLKVGPFSPNQSRGYVVGGTTGIAGQGGHNNGCGIPVTATAVAVQLTALNATAAGSFALAAAGTKPAGTAVSFSPGQAATSGTTQALTPGGGKALTVKALGGGADLRVDVTGYYLQQIEAFVNSDGTVFSQTNRIVSVTHHATGQYYLTIDTDVLNCSIMATAVDSGVSASANAGGGTLAFVYTFNSSGPVDAYFNFVITC